LREGRREGTGSAAILAPLPVADLSLGLTSKIRDDSCFSIRPFSLRGAEKERHLMPRKSPRAVPPGGADQPKYSITTAAELTGVHPQQLRRFEKAGMLSPARSPGGTRRYSDADLAQVVRIRALSDAGVNETGIEQILALQDALQASEARAAAAEARAQASEARQAHSRARQRKKGAQEA
jgi:MerR family transcriptional regulator/heat shock protein HspR